MRSNRAGDSPEKLNPRLIDTASPDFFPSSMLVVVAGQFVVAMAVLVRFPGMIGLVVFVVAAAGVAMGMAVLVAMVMGVGMGMGVAVDGVAMGMVVGMDMAVLVGVLVLVFVPPAIAVPLDVVVMMPIMHDRFSACRASHRRANELTRLFALSRRALALGFVRYAFPAVRAMWRGGPWPCRLAHELRRSVQGQDGRRA